MFKRIVSLLLVFAMVLPMAPVTAMAEETVPEETVAVTTEAATESAEETTAATEAETEPTERETESTEETAAPTEETVFEEIAEEASQEAAYAVEASGSCGDNATWTYGGGVLTISGSGKTGSAPWKSEYANSITTVIVEKGITHLCENSFEYCSNLTSVSLPGTLQSIGNRCFFGCYILQSIILPQGLLSFGEDAFYNCGSLKEITIPTSVHTIGEGAFNFCSSLENIYVAEGNSDYCDVDGVLYSTGRKKLLAYPVGRSGAYTIESAAEELAEYAFCGCDGLTAVTIPNGITEIPECCFHNCTALTAVSLPDSLTIIGDSAFSNCESLTSIDIPDGVTEIGMHAFYNCYKLESIEIPEGVTVLNDTFRDCSRLSHVTLPSTLKELSGWVFNNCWALKSLYLPEGITKIYYGSFWGTGLEAITLPQTVTDIEYWTFAGSDSLKRVTLGENVKSIDSYAFDCNSLSTIVFTGDAPTIADDAFPSVTATVYYPEGNATWTADVMRDYGGNLTWVAGEAPPENTNLQWSFDENTGTLTVSTVEPGPMDDWVMSTVPWKKHREAIKSVVIQEGVTSIGSMAFCNFPKLTSVSIPSTVTSIGNSAFAYSSGLSSVNIPSGLTKIGNKAFLNCRKLSRMTIPGSVTEIGNEAFSGCSGITNLTLEEGIVKIGNSAFAQCASLTEVNIPASLTVLGDGAFGSCEKLLGFIVANGSQSFAVADGILYDKNLTILVQAPSGIEGVYQVPKTVRNIRNRAVWRCTDLQELVFSGTISEIGLYAFYESALTIRHPEDVSWQVLHGDYGGTITWEPYAPGGVGDPDYKTKKTLAELTELDYMAFAHVIYEDFKNNETVQQCMVRHKKWEEKFGNKGVTIALLCEGIADWKVCRIKENTNNGFYAAAFQNSYGEVVIAYRGSENIADLFKSSDAINDWLMNDILMIGLDSIWFNNQIGDAFDMYEEVQKKCKPSEIHVTGHSLGGGLGDTVSARYGCVAETFNAISILDVVYYNYPQRMGANFAGVDKWKITDHANEYDIIAGTFEYYLSYLDESQRIKPYKAYKSNPTPEGLKVWEYLPCHSLHSYVKLGEDGKPELTECVSVFSPEKKICHPLSEKLWYDPSVTEMVNLGTGGKDNFHHPHNINIINHSYGGNGDDTITASIKDDILIGGRGNDTLDGRFGSDTYIYYKGDGQDTIYDTGGLDELILKNFDDDDIIQIMEDDKTDFIHINCNGEDIVRIYKKNRDYEIASLNSFKVVIDGEENNITSFFNKWRSGYSLLAHCPVDVEVLDAEGNVVYILKDGVVGSWYTEYGNFYVFEEENGEYGKILDLREGYTARIVGVDAGTMDIDYREVVDGELGEPKDFANVPISSDFTAVFEATEDGELVLAADTDGDNVVDAKIGYDGKIIPVESVALSQEYLALKPGQAAQLKASVQPTELTEFLRWEVEDDSKTISFTENGEIIANEVGTAYVIASVFDGENKLTARCRVDVAETEQVAEPEKPEQEKIKIAGVQLGSQKVTTELYSTNYAELEVLLKLPQNYKRSSLGDTPQKGSVTIESARFKDDEEMNRLFELVPLDDRRLAVVPRTEIVTNAQEAKTVKGSYKATVEVTVEGTAYPAGELTLSVKKSMPKLTGKVADFNSFYNGQSREILISGGTVVSIRENTSKNTGKTTAIPDWLELTDGILTLAEDAPLKNTSGKVMLLVDTEEWRIPAEVTVNVKNSYKAPGLKLSATNAAFTSDWAASSGVSLKLQPKSAKDSLADMKITGIEEPAGFEIAGFNRQTGEFTLKPIRTIIPGKLALNVQVSGTTVTVPLTLTVKVAAPSLKLSAKSVTLNTAVDDSVAINVTAAPADHILGQDDVNVRVTDSKGNPSTDVTAQWDAETGSICVKSKETASGSYKLYVSLNGGTETAVAVKTVSQEPTVTLKAAGNLDLSFPDTPVMVTANFKNYSGEIVKWGDSITEMSGKTTLDENAREKFTVKQEGNSFRIYPKKDAELNTKNTYTLKLDLELAGGKKLSPTVSLKVKRTAVKLKLSSSKVTLNKKVSDGVTVDVSCTTKGYTLGVPIIEVRDATGKISMADMLSTAYSNGKLTVSVNENTAYGATYKVVLKADAYSAETPITVTVPEKDKSDVTVTTKLSGSLDVIRKNGFITLTPTYKNCNDLAKRENSLLFYQVEGKDLTEVKGLFTYKSDDKGGYVITIADGAEVDHSRKYQVKLVSRFTEGDGTEEAESKPASLSVKMGSAKAELDTKEVILFAEDIHSRGDFVVKIPDAALNDIDRIEIKDKKYVDVLEIKDYENGRFAIGFQGDSVNESLKGKSVNVSLDVYLKGNMTKKANATVRLKVTTIP